MKYIIVFIATLLVCESTAAQDYFQQTIDDTAQVNEQIVLNKIVPAPNGNFLVAGTIGNAGVVMMVDSGGNLVWNKVFKNNIAVRFNTVFALPDGCYVGGSDSLEDGILLKLDVEGNVLGSDLIQNSDGQSLNFKHILTYNNETLIVASRGDKNVFLFKIDDEGNLLPLSRYLFNDPIDVNDAVVDGNNIYLLGWSVLGSNESVGIIVRCDGAGALLWAKKIRLNSFPDTRLRIGSMNVDHTITAIYDARDFGWYSKVGLNRIDSNGNFVFKKIFSKPAGDVLRITGLSVSPGNQVSVCGYFDYSTVDTMMLFRYDENFDLQWSRSFNGFSRQKLLAISETPGGNLVLSGYNIETGNGVIRSITPNGDGCNAKDYVQEEFIKELTILDLYGYSSVENSFTVTPVSLTVSSPLVSFLGCDTLVSAVIEPFHSSIHVFPNPFNQTFKLTTNANSEITIYDVAGQLLESHKTVTGEFSGGEHLNPGIYFIEIENTSGVREIRKVVRIE
ncbi:MAG TPA: T9SS type A sorting domain-containing protein [Chitinophagales bacterium]|nr:T9SS type A sorting domain-containing protein [Chitinophagales bacterium]